MKQLAAALVFASICCAQDVKPTMIGPHRLGESFDEWIIVAKLDLPDICGQHPRSDKRMDFKQVCKILTTLKAGGTGSFRLNDSANNSNFTWSFINARTVAVESLHLGQAAVVLAELTQAYGMATDTRTVTYHNALGAKWECPEADWTLPDGAIIRAKETLLPNFSRITTVTFYTKESAAILANQPKLPNPFLAK